MPTLLHYLEGMFQWGTLRASYRFFLPDENLVWPTNIFILLMLAVEWFQRNKQHGLEMDNKRVPVVLQILTLALFLLLILILRGGAVDFIYFQF